MKTQKVKTQKVSTLSRTLICGAALAGIAIAAGVNAHPGKDGRKALELAEVEQRIDERFNDADTDGDGRLSVEELEAAHANRSHDDWGHMKRKMRRHHQRLREHAADHDVSAEERAARDAAIFAKLDTDGSGTLTSDEFSREKLRDARREMRQAQRFDRLDTDDSGFIERQEFGKRLERLRAADSDGDGTVSRDEMRRAHREFKRS